MSHEHRINTERLSLELDNFAYKLNYLLHEIANVRQWRPLFLEGMVMNELGLDPGGAPKGGAKEEQIINTYLFGNTTTTAATAANTTNEKGRLYQDLKEYEYIIKKIRTDLGERATLVEKISKSKLDLNNLL